MLADLVIRMEHLNPVKRLFLCDPDGKRKVERPKPRWWMECNGMHKRQESANRGWLHRAETDGEVSFSSLETAQGCSDPDDDKVFIFVSC